MNNWPHRPFNLPDPQPPTPSQDPLKARSKTHTSPQPPQNSERKDNLPTPAQPLALPACPAAFGLRPAAPRQYRWPRRFASKPVSSGELANPSALKVHPEKIQSSPSLCWCPVRELKRWAIWHPATERRPEGGGSSCRELAGGCLEDQTKVL